MGINTFRGDLCSWKASFFKKPTVSNSASIQWCHYHCFVFCGSSLVSLPLIPPFSGINEINQINQCFSTAEFGQLQEQHRSIGGSARRLTTFALSSWRRTSSWTRQRTVKKDHLFVFLFAFAIIRQLPAVAEQWREIFCAIQKRGETYPSTGWSICGILAESEIPLLTENQQNYQRVCPIVDQQQYFGDVLL